MENQRTRGLCCHKHKGVRVLGEFGYIKYNRESLGHDLKCVLDLIIRKNQVQWN